MGGVNALDRKLFKQNGIEGERMKTGALCNGAVCGMEREQRAHIVGLKRDVSGMLKQKNQTVVGGALLL